MRVAEKEVLRPSRAMQGHSGVVADAISLITSQEQEQSVEDAMIVEISVGNYCRSQKRVRLGLRQRLGRRAGR